jgi:hypothetical protein
LGCHATDKEEEDIMLYFHQYTNYPSYVVSILSTKLKKREICTIQCLTSTTNKYHLIYHSSVGYPSPPAQHTSGQVEPQGQVKSGSIGEGMMALIRHKKCPQL